MIFLIRFSWGGFRLVVTFGIQKLTGLVFTTQQASFLNSITGPLLERVLFQFSVLISLNTARYLTELFRWQPHHGLGGAGGGEHGGCRDSSGFRRGGTLRPEPRILNPKPWTRNLALGWRHENIWNGIEETQLQITVLLKPISTSVRV